MKKALIITGGYLNIEKISVKSEDFELIIAADSGYLAAEKLNIIPDIIIGDFDSSAVPKTNAELIILPTEKDDTDTMLACRTAIERGAANLLILGGTGGRADHFLSNIFTLEALRNQGVYAELTDGENTIRILEDQTVVLKNIGGYFSLFALGFCKITLSGCKYPLNDCYLTRNNPSLGVSNEVVGDFAVIEITGRAILCESSK